MTIPETRNFLKNEIDNLPENVLCAVRDFIVRHKPADNAARVCIGASVEISGVKQKQWSPEFLEAFSHFGESSDSTLEVPPDIPPEYDIPRHFEFLNR